MFPLRFRPQTVKYELPGNSFVTLKVFDVAGRGAATFVVELKPAGSFVETFHPSNAEQVGTSLPSGMYFYKLTADYFTQTKKMILMK